MDTMTHTPMELGREDAILRPGPFTVDDLEALPDDGYRHELLDGVLVMSPAPRLRHQDVVLSLAALLRGTAPRPFKVFVAPASVRRGTANAIEPDVVVARRADLGDLAVVHRPVLAVEVASPSTRSFDLGRKKELLAQIGCPSYWTIEPDAGPELTVWHLDGDAYTVEAVVTGSEEWTATTPFPVTLRPQDLLDD